MLFLLELASKAPNCRNNCSVGWRISVRREANAEKAWMEFWGMDYNEQVFEGELLI